MNIDALREYCLSFPEATENVQWGNDLVFKIGGKMFTVASLEPGETKVSFKCTPEEFAELVEQDGIRPADYVARYHWVTLLRWDALSGGDVRRLVRDSYEMVKAKLPKARSGSGVEGRRATAKGPVAKRTSAKRRPGTRPPAKQASAKRASARRAAPRTARKRSGAGARKRSK